MGAAGRARRRSGVDVPRAAVRRRRRADVRLRRQRRRPQRRHHRLAAHGFGLAWYEQQRDGGEIAFREHVIMNKDAAGEPVRREVLRSSTPSTWSTWTATASRTSSPASASGRTAARATPTATTRPSSTGSSSSRRRRQGVDFVPYLIDDDSGVGTQVVAGDINGDNLPDIVVGNKKGVFVHLHEKKTVTREEWEKAQPKRRAPTSRASTRGGESDPPAPSARIAAPPTRRSPGTRRR